ncbi:MAG TPA: site-specific integrase [Candidatus Diapherotrites archaeon]|nr:site-specific integrase [Candidatus Diapherotrites archaeon]
MKNKKLDQSNINDYTKYYNKDIYVEHKKHNHTPEFHTLDEVPDFKLSTLVKLWNNLPKIIKKRYPFIETCNYYRDLAILSALYITGGRSAEIVGIRLQDITIEDGWLYIRLPNKKNKRQKSKVIVANIDIEHIFIKYLVYYYEYRLKEVSDLSTPLFPKFTKKRMKETEALLPAAVYKIATRCISINPHFFRKIRASHLLEYYNFDVKALQQYMGWSSIISSEPYLIISKAGLKKNYMQNADEVKKIIDGSDNYEVKNNN